MCADESDMPDICNEEDFDIQSITADMQAMTNLYNSSMFCSECFLELYRLRLLDPWLASTNFTDYLIGQFDSVQKNCSTTLPYTTSSSTLYIGAQTIVTATVTTTDAATATNTATYTAICLGQIVQPITNWLTCDDLSDAASLAELASNSTNNVSESQFLAWNSNIQGSCGGVANGQRVCMEAPGGTWTAPSVTITAPTGTDLYYTTATPAYPTQNGTTESCGKYYQVVSGDDCATVNVRFGLNITQLRSLNTYLDDNCSNLWLDYDICVAPVSTPTVSSDGSCGVGVTCAESEFGK
ncbi:hypothetical protein N7523_000054 [Penicillium sp. IBT 18751x]|nr:hypothetical protein N7523_000054 [Penicillium sp. IBT 18751x]